MTEWERCKPWIEAALPSACGTHTIEDVEIAITDGSMQFWSGRACAVVSEIVAYPQLKALNFFLVGGNLDELRNEMEPMICAWAKGHGCSRVMIVGRPAWPRLLQKQGYQRTFAMSMKEL